MPLLEELDPGIVGHLEALADELAPQRSEGEASSYALPRTTQVALRELAQSRSSSARVWLPGGLVASVDPAGRRTPRPKNHAGSRSNRRKD
ncbi:hypothetical protein AKJ09_07495 [Labilithrix luteola]|uniref:Uncharacterized protein n=1 Tax=Labilithrix luteola TaxID=1391654 RepID=A0A0K1Q5A5_9BACT|nr:hypothetical protein [Labilithrix luteola]AKV00832.1 hypothetical protein AKJ09_07495 [Labilithrix luteola]